ncbi:MAG: hypothetical protein K2Q18_03055, partial [Bdellovibrionales bacterium]|nr:hypothetical protein [Bdellovibrionales bacterium]
KRIEAFKDYTVAFTEGIIKGAVEISAKTKLLLKNPKQTEFKIWQTLQEKVIKDGNRLQTRELTEINKTFYFPEQSE